MEQRKNHLKICNNKWRWVVLAACFISTLLNAPVYFAFGALVLPWMQEFSASGTSIAAVTSIGSSLSCMGCAFGSFVVQKWGYRITHVIGGMMLTISFVASSCAQSLLMLLFTYSITGGIGAGLCLISYTNAVSEHFHNNQVFAFAIVTSAYGVGGIIFPLLFESLIEIYTWRGAMFIMSAILGNVVACGLVLYPAQLPHTDELQLKQNAGNLNEDDYTESKNTEKVLNGKTEENDSFSTDDLPVTRSKNSSSIIYVLFKKCAKNNNEYIENQIPHDREDARKNRTYFQIAKTLLTSWSFYILLVHDVATFMGFFIIFGLTPIRASYDLGLSDSQAAVLVSIFGISQFVGRLLYGLASKYKIVKSSTLYHFGYLAGGVSALFSVYATTYALQIVFCICSSLSFSAASIYYVLVYEVYDRNLYNVAFGYLEVMHGLGSAVGPILGGFFFDISGNCVYSFILAGISIIVGTLILPLGLARTGQIKKLDF